MLLFACFLVLGYATVYEYLNEDICVGTGVNRQIPLNVCHEQLLNNDESEQSESEPQKLIQERQLQEDHEEESSPSSNLDQFNSVAMPDLSMYEELAINITQYTYVKYNCMKGNKTKTVSPVASPSLFPTLIPTLIVTISPSVMPTNKPSATPSARPSSVAPSYLRSYAPTVEETYNPTEVPTQEPTVSLTNEPTLRVGETRAPMRTPTARPSASPSFQAFPVISFVSSRNMSLDAKSTSAVTTNSADGDAFRRAMCATQLKSQGLGSDASCSLTGRVESQKQSVFFLASLLGLSKGLENAYIIPHHFKEEATDTTVVIEFNSQVNMVNHKNTSVSAFINKIVTSSKSFSPKNFTQTLKKQAKAAGLTVTVTGVGSSFVSKNSVVVVSPPTFSPTVTPSTATPTIASPTRTPSMSRNDEDKLPVGAIIGIAVGGTVFILIVVCLLFHKCLAGARKERKSDRQKVYVEK